MPGIEKFAADILPFAHGDSTLGGCELAKFSSHGKMLHSAVGFPPFSAESTPTRIPIDHNETSALLPHKLVW